MRILLTLFIIYITILLTFRQFLHPPINICIGLLLGNIIYHKGTDSSSIIPERKKISGDMDEVHRKEVMKQSRMRRLKRMLLPLLQLKRTTRISAGSAPSRSSTGQYLSAIIVLVTSVHYAYVRCIKS